MPTEIIAPPARGEIECACGARFAATLEGAFDARLHADATRHRLIA
jgi:hypothetical protein